MFYKGVDQCKMKCVETNISYEPYENIFAILETPKNVANGRKEVHEIDKPFDIFEKWCSHIIGEYELVLLRFHEKILNFQSSHLIVRILPHHFIQIVDIS